MKKADYAVMVYRKNHPKCKYCKWAYKPLFRPGLCCGPKDTRIAHGAKKCTMYTPTEDVREW